MEGGPQFMVCFNGIISVAVYMWLCISPPSQHVFSIYLVARSLQIHHCIKLLFNTS